MSKGVNPLFFRLSLRSKILRTEFTQNALILKLFYSIYLLRIAIEIYIQTHFSAFYYVDSIELIY